MLCFVGKLVLAGKFQNFFLAVYAENDFLGFPVVGKLYVAFFAEDAAGIVQYGPGAIFGREQDALRCLPGEDVLPLHALFHTGDTAYLGYGAKEPFD